MRIFLCVCRNWIAEEMRRIDPVGFTLRNPNMTRKEAEESLPQGPHFAWTGCGYEKLTQIGFPIWCVRDSWTINWLGMWVLPVRQDKLAHIYQYLGLVKSLEGVCSICSVDRMLNGVDVVLQECQCKGLLPTVKM